MGTGFADHAAVPCQAPDCPVPARTPGLSDWEQRIDSAQSIGDLRALSREMETAGVLENRRLLRRRAKRAASFLFAARVRATTPENGATQ
jgi:hypothetical protein